MKSLARHRFAFIQVFDCIAAPLCLSPTLTRRERGDKNFDRGNVEKTLSTASFHRARLALPIQILTFHANTCMPRSHFDCLVTSLCLSGKTYLSRDFYALDRADCNASENDSFGATSACARYALRLHTGTLPTAGRCGNVRHPDQKDAPSAMVNAAAFNRSGPRFTEL